LALQIGISVLWTGTYVGREKIEVFD
jgi:hypothetical protein